jgi:16S rRNA (cytosine967-C5)-methyltransferase
MADIRNDCLNLVNAVLEDHRPSHLVIAEYLDTHAALEDRDRSFVKRLVMGVVERKLMLDHVIDAVSKTKVTKMKPAIRGIIRMGVYQLIYMNVPDSAACNESVKLAKKRGFTNLGGFVNGVLRTVAKNKDGLTDLTTVKDDITRMSLRFSMPEWIVRYFCDNYGKEAAERAFGHYFEPSKTFIRCNSSKIAPDELFERLKARGIAAEKTDIERCLKISDYSKLGGIPEFEEGLFTVQDMSSIMAGEIADVRPGIKVLDLCAAPGGKSLNIADRMMREESRSADSLQSTGDGKSVDVTARGGVISCDISEQKVRLIDENIARCGFQNIVTRVNDATVFVPDFENAFDIVIADVPCSGLGIIGRKPDIKYNMTPEGQKELVALQRSILENAVRYVKQGGRLLFSTCTVNRAENEENVSFIERKGFKCELQKQLLPGDNGADGFFYAKLIKA